MQEWEMNEKEIGRAETDSRTKPKRVKSLQLRSNISTPRKNIFGYALFMASDNCS